MVRCDELQTKSCAKLSPPKIGLFHTPVASCDERLSFPLCLHKAGRKPAFRHSWSWKRTAHQCCPVALSALPDRLQLPQVGRTGLWIARMSTNSTHPATRRKTLILLSRRNFSICGLQGTLSISTICPLPIANLSKPHTRGHHPGKHQHLCTHLAESTLRFRLKPLMFQIP